MPLFDDFEDFMNTEYVFELPTSAQVRDGAETGASVLTAILGVVNTAQMHSIQREKAWRDGMFKTAPDLVDLFDHAGSAYR